LLQSFSEIVVTEALTADTCLPSWLHTKCHLEDIKDANALTGTAKHC